MYSTYRQAMYISVDTSIHVYIPYVHTYYILYYIIYIYIHTNMHSYHDMIILAPVISIHLNLQTTLYVDVWDSGENEGGDVHLIDKFTITIPETVSNCLDQSNTLTVQGKHGIGILTLSYFNLSTDPITSCSSPDVSQFSTSSQSDYGNSCE